MKSEVSSKNEPERSAPSFFKEPPSPLASLLLVSLAIFTVEFFIMFAEGYFRPLSPLVWDAIDATLLLLVTNPILYFFVYKPLAHHVRKRDELLAKEIAEKDEILRKDGLIQLINEITFAANDAKTVEDALDVCLAQICRHVGWPVGHACKVVSDHEGVRLVSMGVWRVEGPKTYSAFRSATDRYVFKPGEGGPGRAYLTQKPVWIADVTKIREFKVSGRMENEGIAEGLRGCFFFPVLSGEKAVAILEFFTDKAEEPDPVIMEVISKLAIQMGRVMERKEAEISLKTMSGVIERAMEAFVLTNSDGTITYVNPAFERETEYAKEETIGRHLNEMISFGQPGMELLGEMWPTVRAGKVWSGQVTSRKKNGDQYEDEMVVSPIEDSEGVITNYIVIKRDVTEKRMLQNQLIQAEKMFTVGAFVSGVAHELNNPLTAILGFSQRLLTKGADFPPDVRHQLEIISEQTKRSVKIVQNLLKFSRKQPATTIYCNVNEVVDNTLAFLEYGLRSDNIEVRKNYARDPVRVKGDVSQLQQVFTNIILNGEYEMKKAHGRGVMNIRTDVTDVEARIEIENDGPPIPKAVRERIFDPFFSTKGLGEGTGLGLYIAYGIVADHKGKIFADSPGEAGARFVITLPLAEPGAVPSPAPAKESPPGADLAGKRVLVVEDEEYIRRWISELFEDKGSSVHMAKDGEEAIDFIGKNEYDLIISDIKMPRKTGYELARWLYENKPEYRSKFLFITGVIDGEVEQFCKKYGFVFLQKPFGVNELLTSMRGMKDNRLKGD